MKKHDTCGSPAEMSGTQGQAPRNRRTTRPLARRPDFEVAIDLESEHNFYAGVGGNVGTGGLFIRTHATRPPGTRLRVRFNLCGLPNPAELDAIVRWVLEVGEIEEHGIGVQLLEVPPSIRSAIETFAAQRDPLLHEPG